MQYPTVAQVVLDGPDARKLAEFYRQLFGLRYRDGDEPPPDGEPDPRGADWLVLRNPGGVQLAFQQVDQLPEATWPEGEHPQMLHLDTTVPSVATLNKQHERVLALGGGCCTTAATTPRSRCGFIGIRPATRSACLSTRWIPRRNAADRSHACALRRERPKSQGAASSYTAKQPRC